MKLSQHGKFKRRALLLFLIISLAPALTVGSLWYLSTSYATGSSFVAFGSLIAPIALLGLLPATVLAVVFAEVLAIPIRKLHEGITEISRENFNFRIKSTSISEFHEMTELLNGIAQNLQQTLSQKDTENDLIASERNKLRAVLNNMNDGVLALDKSNRIILFNRAAGELAGRSIEMVAGKPFAEAMPFSKNGAPVILDWLLEQSSSSKATEHWNNLELEAANGETLQVNAQVILLPGDPNGLKMLMTFHDLTKSKQLEEMELNFVALAAHELRTPITTIRGYLDILDTEIGPKLDKNYREMLFRSQSGVTSLSTLVNNLLSVSRIEQGKLAYDFEQTSWEKFIENLHADLKTRIAGSTRKLIVKLDPNLPEVVIDHLAISEVFYNLIDNAVHYTDEGSTITVASKAVHNGVETTITDTGAGIPKQAVGRLFQKFYRVEGMKSHASGTGLGLYICKQIVEAHQGSIWVESEEGKGTTFGIILPPSNKVAQKLLKTDNIDTKIMRGAHGWIKKNSTH